MLFFVGVMRKTLSMRHRRRISRMSCSLTCILNVAGILTSIACATDPSPTIATSHNPMPAMPVIQLEQLVHFLAPDGSDRPVPAGIYEVLTWEANRLVLLPQISQEPFLIQAQTTEHQRALTTPVAVIIPDSQNEDMIHLVLLRPEHMGWDAAGSLSGVQSRAAILPKASLAQLNAANIAMPKTSTQNVLARPSSQSSLKSTTAHSSSPQPRWVP